jgi:S-DNA-T family DNA segregation ATPase FtsK/SpoIIIE
VPAKVIDFKTGPAVTQYAVEPGYVERPGADGVVRKSKVRVAQISALANDLALALQANTIRIEAPVPGTNFVGIEVPNRKTTYVGLRGVMESENFVKIGAPLAIAMGRDVSGTAVTADLAKMPHVLVAGTTGSGKSVCITSIIACLTMNNTPEDLRLILIDPKMVELVRFNGLPHLLGKVEVELERIVGVLKWATREMDRRYKLFETVQARDLNNYNDKIKRNGERLPRIVIVLDELADLMMMAPDETERTLVRLAQMARATGMHLVVATQRPSTDIVTGLIKANFPARISFAVASGIDSRVILDVPGAEALLGRGDMLFLSPEAGTPQRLQGCYVGDKEIDRLVSFWREQFVGEEMEEIVPEKKGKKFEDDGDADSAAPRPAPWDEQLARDAVLKNLDPDLEAAIALVKKHGNATASLLQRKMNIGFPRAARLMDELYELGIVGRAQEGGKKREVLVEKHDDVIGRKAKIIGGEEEEEDDEGE